MQYYIHERYISLEPMQDPNSYELSFASDFGVTFTNIDWF